MSARSTAYEKAQELAASQKNEAALMAFEDAMKEEPENFKALAGAGLMLQRLGRHDEAIAAFSCTLEREPELAEIHYSRAVSLQDLGRHTEALVDLESALALKPDYVDARYASGVNLKALERFDEALRAFTEVLDRVGVYPEASHGRATIRSLNGDLAGVIDDFTICIEQGIDHYGVRLLRGLAWHRLGRHAEAIEDLTRAIAFSPDEGSTYIRRWQVYRALGDTDRAAEDMRVGTELMSKPRGPAA